MHKLQSQAPKEKVFPPANRLLLSPFIFSILFSLYSGLFTTLQAQTADSLVPVVYRFDSGEISSEGFLRNGQPDGYWKSYYRNGILKTEGNRKNFQLDGIWKFYNEAGEVQTEITYQEDIKEGLSTTYLKGVKIKEEPYSGDKKEGLARYYHPETGNLWKEVPFVNNREQGSAFEYDTTGTIITLLTYKQGVLVKRYLINRTDDQGRKQGNWMEFYPTRSTKVEGTYRNDLKHGYWKYYAPDGNLIRVEKWVDGVLQTQAQETVKVDIKREINPNTGKLAFMGAYRNGIPDGIHRTYNDEGEITGSTINSMGTVLEKGGYVDEQGRKQGVWTTFYLDGAQRSKGAYKDGLKTGEWLYYFQDGKVEQKGIYVRDLPEETWYWYYPNGQERKVEEYVNGLADGPSVEYNDSGVVLVKGQYVEGLKEGEWIYEVGDHKEVGKYFEDERTGIWKHYDLETKQLRYEGEWLNGMQEGLHSWYYPNGQVKKRGTFNGGKKEGLWEFFSINGARLLTIGYQDGVEKEYNGVKIKYGRGIE